MSQRVQQCFVTSFFSPFVNLWPALVVGRVLIASGVLENLADYLHSKHQGTGNAQLNYSFYFLDCHTILAEGAKILRAQIRLVFVSYTCIVML